MLRAGVFVLVLLALSLVGRPLKAEAPRVVLVHGGTQSAIVSEAMTRIRGELIADGFEVSVVDAPPDSDRAAVLASANRETAAAATLGLFVQEDAKAAEVWVVDRLTQKTVVRRIEMTDPSADSAPEVLARRSVELLRASLLEILIDEQERPASRGPHEEASRWAAKGLARKEPRWGVAAGAEVLTSFGGVGSTVMPVGRVRFVLVEPLSARLSLAGLGTQPEVEAPVGAASVSQTLGLLELVGEFLPRSRVRPSVSLGAGSYLVAVDGTAISPYAGMSDERFTFATDLGAGLVLSLSSSLALTFEGHTTLITPYPVIRFVGVDTAEIKNPLLSAALALEARL